MKYRSKPVEIEVIRLTRKTADVCMAFIGEANIADNNDGEFAEDACYIDIVTLEGVMTASEGDWIIKGLIGEFYPCKDEVFQRKYELVESSGISGDVMRQLSDEQAKKTLAGILANEIPVMECGLMIGGKRTQFFADGSTKTYDVPMPIPPMPLGGHE